MQQIFRTFTITVISFSLFFTSCKKNEDASPTALSQTDITIEDAKSWLEENKSDLDLSQNWNYSILLDGGSGGKVLKVKLNDSLINNKTLVLSDLLFKKDVNGDVETIIYRVLVDTGYFASKPGANEIGSDKRNYITDADFTGDIILYTIDNEIIKGRRFVSGIAKSDLELANKSNGNHGTVMNAPSIGDDNSGSGIQLNEVIIYGTPPPFIFPPRNTDLPGGSTTIPVGNNSGGAGGGGGSSIPGGGYHSAIQISIADRLKYPHLAQVIDNLLNVAKRTPALVAALKKYSNMTDEQIYEGLAPGKGPVLRIELLSENTNAITTPSPDNVIIINSLYAERIHLLINEYPYAFDLFLASSILHEFIHYGENINYLQHPDDPWGNDAGKQFENEYFGGDVDYDFANDVLTFRKLPKQ